MRRLAGQVKRATLDRLDRRPVLVCHGHSFLNHWPPLLAGYRVVNYNRGGSVVADTLALVLGMPPPAPEVTCVVEVGLNDARRHGTDPGAVQRFGDDLGLLVDRLSSRGAPVVVLLDPPIRDWRRWAPDDAGSPEALALYRDAVRSLGPAIDLAVDWDVASMIRDDGVHPSDLGARHLAATVENGLKAHETPIVRRAR